MDQLGNDLEEGWNELAKKFEKIDAEKIQSIIKRCPKCKKITLTFDPDSGRIHCTACGFEYFLQR